MSRPLCSKSKCRGKYNMPQNSFKGCERLKASLGNIREMILLWLSTSKHLVMMFKSKLSAKDDCTLSQGTRFPDTL